MPLDADKKKRQPLTSDTHTRAHTHNIQKSQAPVPFRPPNNGNLYTYIPTYIQEATDAKPAT